MKNRLMVKQNLLLGTIDVSFDNITFKSYRSEEIINPYGLETIMNDLDEYLERERIEVEGDIEIVFIS